MYSKVANDFSPVVRFMYNSGASTIPSGHAVMRAPDIGAVLVPDPVDNASPMRYIIGVKLGAASITANQQNVLGVAMETASTSTWFPVCIGGPCQVRVSAATVLVAGSPLGAMAAASAHFISITCAAAIWSVPAVALQSQSVTAGALVDAYIEPIKCSGGGGFFT